MQTRSLDEPVSNRLVVLLDRAAGATAM